MKSRNIIFGAILSVVACFGLSPIAQAVSPAPDGSYANGNTAEGLNALLSLTTGTNNNAFGNETLKANTTGKYNTATGSQALKNNNGNNNTANGFQALVFNTDGSDNAATGWHALYNNTHGTLNTANGSNALRYNTTGSDNNAFGAFALYKSNGDFNNALGRIALTSNTTGIENEAFGDRALRDNVSGSHNTAMGDDALLVSTGDGNTAMGEQAGNTIVDGTENVCIGDGAGGGIVHAHNSIAIGVAAAGPFADFNNTCFIGSIHGQFVGDPGSQQAVYVDGDNVVGIMSSSRRYKHDIQPMDKASETLYRLKPVTFKYNSDKKGTPQYGLIAEEVAEVDPQLVSHDKDGEISSVHYEQINNMLLNEFLKEHKKVQDLEVTVVQQQKGMDALTAQLKEQAAQIQKVSAQLEMSKPATKVALGNQ